MKRKPGFCIDNRRQIIELDQKIEIAPDGIKMPARRRAEYVKPTNPKRATEIGNFDTTIVDYRQHG